MKYILFAALLASSPAFANQLGFVGGLNFAGGEVDSGDGSSEDIDREIGFDVGVRYLVAMEGFTIRTGFQIAKYNGSLSGTEDFFGTIASFDIDYSALQFKIPITAMYSVNKNFGFFGGFGVSLNLDDEIEGTVSAEGMTESFSDDADVESLWLTFQVGVIAMFSENLGAELVFDYGLTDFGEDTEINVLALNFVYLH